MDADDIAGAFLKKDSVRFYEIVKNNEYSQTLEICTEVHVSRDSDGKVVSGTYNVRANKQWKAKTADMKNVYAVIHRRAVHKKTQADGGSFTRTIMIMVMHLVTPKVVQFALNNLLVVVIGGIISSSAWFLLHFLI